MMGKRRPPSSLTGHPATSPAEGLIIRTRLGGVGPQANLRCEPANYNLHNSVLLECRIQFCRQRNYTTLCPGKEPNHVIRTVGVEFCPTARRPVAVCGPGSVVDADDTGRRK